MRKLTTEEFIERANQIHNNKYDYSKTNYINMNTKVKIICPIHGEFLQTPRGHLVRKGCAKCAQNNKSNTEEFVKKAKEIYGDKYDYSEVEYLNNKTKVKIKCNTCGSIFYKTPHNHLIRGCAICSKKHQYTTKEFIESAKKVHGDKYDYSLTEYKNANTDVKIICSVHGEFEQNPRTHIKGNGCPFCYTKSCGEELIAKVLEDNNFILNETYFREYKFEECRDTLPLPFDFYIPEKNLLIEYNGIQHYEKSTFFKDTRKSFLTRKHHDWLKRKYARDNNIDLLIIPYWDYSNIFNLLKNYKS